MGEDLPWLKIREARWFRAHEAAVLRTKGVKLPYFISQMTGRFSMGFKKKDILTLIAVFFILLVFFGFLFYAFEMKVWIALPFAVFFEIVAFVLLMIKKKKPSFPLKQITGILIIVVGLGAAAIPFVAQHITASRQKEMIDDIAEYLAGIEKKEASGYEAVVSETTEQAVEQETVTNEALERDKETIGLLRSEEIYGILEIPSINIKYAIVQGTDRVNLRAAVGHMLEGVDAGQEGNCILAAHRGGYYGTFFKNINRLKNGAEIYITDLDNNKYTYQVYEQKWIDDHDWDELEAEPGEKILTLLSCEEHGTLRIIVKARIVE